MTKVKQDTHIWVKQKGGLAGKSAYHRAVLLGIGLKRLGQVALLKDTACIRGMVEKVQHLIEIQVRPGAIECTGARYRGNKKA